MQFVATPLLTKLSACWDCAPGQLHLLSQASHALTVIHAAVTASGRTDPEFWFPAYFGGDTLRPLIARGGRYRFYPVLDDFSPDWEACEAMAATRVPDVFTLAHYFGVEGDIAGARAFCDGHGALLHEDVAHALLPYGGVGKFADFVSYSPRKFVKLPDGGVLVARSSAALAAVQAALPALAGLRNSAWDWHMARLRADWQWSTLRQRAVEMLKGKRRRTKRGRRRFGAISLDDDPTNPQPFERIWLSTTSRLLLSRMAAKGELEAIARRRSAKVARLAAAMEEIPGIRHIAPVDGAAPRWTAFRGTDEASTLAAINSLRDRGVRAYTWPRLAPEIKADSGSYGAAMPIRRTLIRLSTS